ncbi:MAG: outer membrane protein OmpK, partial [Plesiomonas shigelloides]
PTPSITTGIQYRYADKKLGSEAYQNAMVYSIKYNF